MTVCVDREATLSLSAAQVSISGLHEIMDGMRYTGHTLTREIGNALPGRLNQSPDQPNANG